MVLKSTYIDVDLINLNVEYVDLGYEKILIDKEIITFKHYANRNSRFVEYYTNFKTNILEYNKSEDILKINDEVINLSSNGDIIEFNFDLLNESVINSSYTWKYYNTKTGSVGVDIRDTATVAGTLFLLVGSGGVGSFMIIAGVIVGRTYDKVYYVKEEYYKEPITTSRLELAHYFKFYGSSNQTNYIGGFDTRY